jgi:hypothetical protein
VYVDIDGLSGHEEPLQPSGSSGSRCHGTGFEFACRKWRACRYYQQKVEVSMRCLSRTCYDVALEPSMYGIKKTAIPHFHWRIKEKIPRRDS